MRSFKIPNRLCLFGCISGMGIGVVNEGLRGLPDKAIWCVAVVIVLFPLYMCGITGAGDVKLYAVIGAYLCKGVVLVIVLSFAAAALYGAVLVVQRLLLRRKLELTRIHMTVPIAAAMFIVMLGGMV